MFPICLCSVIALAIVIERLLFFKKSAGDIDGFYKTIQDYLHQGKNDKALDHCKYSSNPLGRIIETGLAEKDVPRWKLEEKLTLEKNIRGLEVIATISPLRDLLGTFIGMVHAFNKVAQHKGQVDPGLLAGRIWEALLTTLRQGWRLLYPLLCCYITLKEKLKKLLFN
jgi:biopolymer transport protein ExbB